MGNININIIDAGVIAIIPYSEVKFRFVSNHYDEHLIGNCIYNNELCAFRTISGEYNEETNTWTDSVCKIYKLSRQDKLRWLFKQWLFEKCVGYHWSYSDKKDVKSFYYRNPQWLYKFLFDWYYKKGKNLTELGK